MIPIFVVLILLLSSLGLFFGRASEMSEVEETGLSGFFLLVSIILFVATLVMLVAMVMKII